MNRLKHILLGCLLMVSCMEIDETVPGSTEGIAVSVTREVCISLQPVQTVGGLSTRTSTQPEKGEAIGIEYLNEDVTTRATDKTTEELTINNGYILQFGGTSATSVLKKKQAITADQLKSGNPLTCAFVMTSGVKNRVYVVANCTKTLTEGTTTLGDFEAPVPFSPGTAVPEGGLPMSACQDVGIGDEFEPFLVKSLLAKLTFTCKTAGATLKLKGLPTGYSFRTQAEPANDKLRPTGMTYNASGFTMASGTTYYVPENLSGRNELLIRPVTRALGMAPDNAMYVEITNASTVYNLLLGDGNVSDFNVAGNYVYTLSATVYGTDPYDLRIGNPVASLPVDLNSSGETANCYITTAADTWYMFRNDVMGNGAVTPAHAKSAVSGDADFPAIIPEPLHTNDAEVLWETQNTATAPVKGSVVGSNVYLLKDRILFKTGSSEGNAVIAARGANNMIIWSWHIWRINSQPAEKPLAAISTLMPDGEIVVMDRNLGALSAVPQGNLSIGLLYQWGRKDPFPGGVDLSSTTTMMSTTPGNLPALGTGGSITVETAVQNPTVYYKGSSDWTTRNDNLWGTPLTGMIVINDRIYNSNQGGKSIYDPCPIGWRMPPAYVFANASTSRGNAFANGYSFVMGQNNADIWFPATGNRNNGSGVGNFVGGAGDYSVSTPSVYDPTYGSRLSFNSSIVNSADYGRRASAYSCRCVKETSIINVPSTPVVDLNTDGKANCYIVTSPGTYTFDATIMGNGKTTPAHAKGSISGDADFPAITPAKLSPVSVNVLWETFNTTKAPVKGDIISGVVLKDGKVIFNTGSKEGNAVIAVRDVNDNIIWSWHIWRTNSQPAEQPLAAIGTVTTAGEMVLMDRNLGALSAKPQDNLSIGLYYQWGRKDPFPGGADLSSETTTIATVPRGIPDIPVSEAQYSVAQAIAQPTTFLKYAGDWCATRNDNLWGTPLTTKISVNSNDFNANKGVKSIYDPCPLGWRTPPAYAFANIAKSNGGAFDKGYSFAIGQNNNVLWFPASGNRGSSIGGLFNIGAKGYCWSSTSHVNYLGNVSILYFNSDEVIPMSGALRAGGFSIRCCKE